MLATTPRRIDIGMNKMNDDMNKGENKRNKFICMLCLLPSARLFTKEALGN